MTRPRALLLATAIVAAFLGVAQTRTSQIITFTLGSTVVTLGTTTTTIAGLTLTTPVLGVATATSINKVAITAPATSATLTIQDGTTLSYTQGTWTPTLVGSATPGTGQTYSTQVGSYEQIGRLVVIRFALVATSLGTAAGNLQVGGLPVANNGTANDFGGCTIFGYNVSSLAALNYGISGRIGASASLVDLFSFGSTSITAVTVAASGGTPTIQGLCLYHT